MGPALLSCPSSSAVQLLGQASPSKSLVLCASNGHLGHAHGTTDFAKKVAISTSFSGKCRENSYTLSWRKVFAAASVEEPPALTDEIRTEISTTTLIPEEGTNAEPKPPRKKTLSRSNSGNNRVAILSPSDIVPGATFTGKVTNIQPFGAFVDFGAFTNGLVHVSKLSKDYVEKVEDVVQNGQDVNVQILDVDFASKRISLTLVEEESKEEVQKKGGGDEQAQGRSQPKGRSPRRDTSRGGRQSANPTTTMKKGEIANATVKNIIKSGVFLTLPDGTDGYLPSGEVVFKTPNINLEAQFQVGQEVTVRILRLERGRVTLSTKQEMDYTKINEDLNKDVVGGATNPFEIAFRRDELIASFLTNREKQKGGAEVPLEERPSLAESVVVAHHVNGLVVDEVFEQEKTSDGSVEEHEESKEPINSAKDTASSSDYVSSLAESVGKLVKGEMVEEAKEMQQSEEPVVSADKGDKGDIKESSNDCEVANVAEGVVGTNAQQC